MGKTRFIDLSFEGGINEYAETTTMPETYGSIVQNWVPEPSGGLRIPRGWIAAPTAGLTGTKTARGIGYFVPAAGPRVMVGQASGTSSEVKLVAIPMPIAGQTFTTVETILGSATAAGRTLAMAAGGGFFVYCNPDFPGGRIRKWDGTTASDVSTDAIAGRALAFHNNRFFTGGALANPTYLRWSELGDVSNWAPTTNFQPVDQEDGEPIEALAPWDAGLLVGKANSVHYLTGFGPDTFSLHNLDGGGCAPGRTLVGTPGGAMAIGRERIWWFGGGGFEPISQPIENTYGMTGSYMSGAYIDGDVYVTDEGSGTTFIYNIATKAWHTETFDSIAEGPGIVATITDLLIGGSRAATANSLISYRSMPGAPRARWPGSAQTFRAQTGDQWFGGPMLQSTPLHLHLQIRQRGGTEADTPLTVQQYVDGVLERTETVPLAGVPGVYRRRVDLGHTGYSHRFDFSMTVGAASSGIIDIERIQVEIQDERPR